MNPVELNLFASRVAAICDEMGVVLRRAAFSPNIKDRLDFSCALFDSRGRLFAQAAHIPVHLGSMAYAMGGVVRRFDWVEGDMAVFNDPYLGGTHLPDVTLVAPVFHGGELAGFVANRAHHANIGCDTPGSMPLSETLAEEGEIIPPTLLYRGGELRADVRLPGSENGLGGDFAAQAGANQVGARRLGRLLDALGIDAYRAGIAQLNDYAERIARNALGELAEGSFRFRDFLDDDGFSDHPVPLELELRLRDGAAELDFSASADQVRGNLNCPEPVVAAAAFYCFRCLFPERAPVCDGLFRPLRLIVRKGSVLNANAPAAVAAGNVETSMRLVDLIFGALAQALPGRIPAASQGTMNNVAMGAADSANGERWDYYETLAGGMGAGPRWPGLHARHSHMTNTLNTPVESLEMHYPLRVRRYALRAGSGGAGRNRGGDGLVREYEFLAPASLSLLSERRRIPPWGLQGGEAGQTGENQLNGKPLPAKCTLQVAAGDRLVLSTPGGGGFAKRC
ncbi:MAG: hydantoinase B/oxoprolinase family protein [Gammaproteobacteria bacterium]|nr:hydantoinase B/oxoprolinase family protein [Gammaproteobacteria bacterium]